MSERGIGCPYCGCMLSFVTDTRKVEYAWRGRKRTMIRRYRSCRHCERNYPTVEYLHEEIMDAEQSLPRGLPIPERDEDNLPQKAPPAMPPNPFVPPSS